MDLSTEHMIFQTNKWRNDPHQQLRRERGREYRQNHNHLRQSRRCGAGAVSDQHEVRVDSYKHVDRSVSDGFLHPLCVVVIVTKVDKLKCFYFWAYLEIYPISERVRVLAKTRFWEFSGRATASIWPHNSVVVSGTCFRKCTLVVWENNILNAPTWNRKLRT